MTDGVCAGEATERRTGLSEAKLATIRSTIAGDPKLGARVRTIVLFGSRAKGSWREGSDIDIAVEGDGITAADGWRWADQLQERLLPWSVDCVIVDARTNPDLLGHIRRVGIALYTATTRM